MLITSDRQFGVEIEFFCKTKAQVRNVMSKLPIVEDGSIRHIPNAFEYVSPILKGQTGFNTIHSVCEVLKKNSASGDNQSMSVHVHLDGKIGMSSIQTSTTEPPVDTRGGNRYYAVSSLLRKIMPATTLTRIIKGGMIPRILDSGEEIFVSEFDGILYLSLAELQRKPRKNYNYIWLNSQSRFNWVQNMFYFYTKYSDVMEAIVSNSRKFGNMYCIPLGVSYTLEEIRGCKNMQELQNVWYKHRPKGNHYDDSRYHNVNLHSLWDRHGTIEIRSHGGTVDPNKILLWVKLHQKIADKLETMTLKDIDNESSDDLYKSFVEFVEEPVLKDYVKRLLGFYSGIIIK